jgi:steroid delta-isomerase-like uncharacterized protein
MTDEKVLEFCKSWLKAWGSDDTEKLLSFYHENAFYQDPVVPNGIQGRPQLEKYISKAFGRYKGWSWEFEKCFPTEGGVFVKYTATVPLKDRTYKFQGVDLLEISDGKITRNEAYFDPEFHRAFK